MGRDEPVSKSTKPKNDDLDCLPNRPNLATITQLMKDKIHPQYQQITATCACGASFLVGSTKTDIRVDLCSNCHPVFTGQSKIVDSEGRVDRFKKRFAKKTTTAAA